MENNVGPVDRKLQQFEQKPSIGGRNHLQVPKRKFSFPAALHANLLGLSNNSHQDQPLINNTKRRFSNVGDVVSRKLSNTIGWRTPSVPPEEVISQGRVLCGQFIRNRLKRSGIFSKKLGLYRLRSMVGTTSGMIVREVFPSLVCAGTELERLHPKVYSNVTRQACISPTGILVSDKAVAGLFVAISHEMLRSDINWGKVIAVFSIAGGLAVDCVLQGHPEYLHGIMDGMTEVLEDNLADWIASNGGWIALNNQCRHEDDTVTVVEYTTIVILLFVILIVLYYVVRFFGKLGIF